MGGVEEYLSRQLAGLAVADPAVSVLLAAPPGFAEAHPELQQTFDIAVGPFRTTRLRGRLLEEMRWLPRRLAGLDVIHHGNGTISPFSPGPVTLTITDLQYRRFPEYFAPARLNYLRWMIPRSARKASVIAVPSEFVRGLVIDAFGVDERRVVVVPHSVPAIAGDAVDEADIRRRFGLGARRVLVYPAVTYPHKGHRLLIDLLAGPWAHEDIVLVFIGGKGRADEEVSAAIAARGVVDRVVRPGRVSAADRDGLISVAEGLLFPSEYEGFGAPAIEAMALGTPVVCSDQAALPEVVGDAAIVLPLDLDTWATSLDRIASEASSLIARGYRRAEEFSIEAAGAALARTYRLAV